jgi:hypothetical protein
MPEPTIDPHDLELPQSVLDDLRSLRERPSSEEILKGFVTILLDKRRKAIDDRSASGIEAVWQKDEEYYHGVDESSRVAGNVGIPSGQRWIKPPTSSGPLRLENGKAVESQDSTAFVRLTARYVDAGAAKAVEILLPSDDKAFSFGPTPIPELIEAMESTAPVAPGGVPLQRDPLPQEMPLTDPSQPAPHPSQLPGVTLTEQDLAAEKMAKAVKRAKAAETRIFDWTVEGKFTREMRLVVHDAAKLGVGVLKGPYPEKRSARMVTHSGEETTIAMQVKVVPAFKRVNPWNFFPDPACGERIDRGSYIFERDFISESQLEDLKRQPGYSTSAIDKVIAEGPGRKKQEDAPAIPAASEDSYAIWYFHGFISKQDQETLNYAFDRSRKDPLRFKAESDRIYAVVTMINDTPIHAVAGPSDTGKIPYHAIPWQPRSGSWAGVGVAEQVWVPQEMVNGATRAMVDNAGKSSGTIMAIDRQLLEPVDNNWTMRRDKMFYTKSDSINDDVRKAITTFEIPNRTPQLMTIIEYAFRLAEESSSIPLITQGQSGKTAPETYGAAQLQNNNANQLLRNIAVNFDDYITEPVVEELHEWLLLDPDVPMEEKDDFQIHAHGSSALVERAIQVQFIQSLAPMVLNPAFGIDPKLWTTEMLRGVNMDPSRLVFSPEKQKKIDSTPPPPPPQVLAAQIRAQSDLQRAKMDTDRDTEFVKAESERTHIMAQGKKEELQLKYQIALAQYASDQKMTLDEAKTDLAVTALKMRTQKELAAAKAPGQVEKPPTEPPGKAPTGEAYQA